MAFTENSKLYAVKVVDGQKLLFEASKDEVRKAPRVDTLPSPSGNKRGLIYLYDDGNGEKGYICVKTGNDCEWLPLGGMSKEVYDNDSSVEKAGGIKDYVYNQIEDLSDYIERQLSQKQNILFFDSTPTYSSFNPVTSDGIKAAIDASANVQSDWSTYNSASKSYVKNRPIYDDRRAGDTICSGTVTTSTSYTLTAPDGYSYHSTADRNYAAHRRLYEYLNPGRTYSVNLRGVDYGFYTAKIGTITHNGYAHNSAVYIDIIGFALLAQWVEVVGDYQEFVLFIGTYSTGSTAFTLRSIEGSLGPLDKKYASWAEQIDNRVSSISQRSDDNHYPTAKAVYDYVTSAVPVVPETKSYFMLEANVSDNTLTFLEGNEREFKSILTGSTANNVNQKLDIMVHVVSSTETFYTSATITRFEIYPGTLGSINIDAFSVLPSSSLLCGVKIVYIFIAAGSPTISYYRYTLTPAV